MCGRFERHTPLSAFAEWLGIAPPDAVVPACYNIPPGTAVPVAVAGEDGPRLTMASWGFRPDDVDDPGAPQPINARAETVASSRYFARAFREARCLVPADGWYEWRAGPGGVRQPWHLDVGAPLMFAAVHVPGGHAGGALPGMAIITEPARGAARRIHPRMPVVLDPSCWRAWLDPALNARERIRAAVRPVPGEQLRLWPVSTRVNSPRNDDPGLIERDPSAGDG
ncbi:putative SOS response-associated peptidase YedK [wastewater metagenome]|uniref:Putative SOS response-associated peptidase YedK n=2 Tax=unclassified sequences TaxID=12908 RepID=A0A5B8RJ17_9ZZZZ|nr:SOS response-associated peptidase [Arhodomonas sp. KWT]QEA07055.1 putative SOS response-associated peptidase YedK [uncultured organism]